MQKLLLILLFSTLTACTTTRVTGTLEGRSLKELSPVALLPLQTEGEISRERAQLVHKLVRSELQSKGFTLVDDQAVQRFCANMECPNRADLVRLYGIQTLIENRLSSVARSNFLAGYVNSISGALTLSTPQGGQLFKVEHAQRERGGLLFNTGQLAQGIIQIANNAKSDESFSVLAGLYAKYLVDSLPTPGNSASTGTQAAASITSTTIQPEGAGADRVCAHGTPGSFASLVYGKIKSSLRETMPGHYCGFFNLADFPPGTSFAIELRSAYSDLARVALSPSLPLTCKLADAVHLRRDGARIKLEVACAPATYKKFLVFRAPAAFGAFERVGEFKGNVWSEPAMGDSRYALVAITPRGETVAPVLVETKKGKSDA